MEVDHDFTLRSTSNVKPESRSEGSTFSPEPSLRMVVRLGVFFPLSMVLTKPVEVGRLRQFLLTQPALLAKLANPLPEYLGVRHADDWTPELDLASIDYGAESLGHFAATTFAAASDRSTVSALTIEALVPGWMAARRSRPLTMRAKPMQVLSGSLG